MTITVVVRWQEHIKYISSVAKEEAGCRDACFFTADLGCWDVFSGV